MTALKIHLMLRVMTTPTSADKVLADSASTLANEPFFQRCAAQFRALQAQICAEITTLDGSGEFGIDSWKRPHGGDGGPILGGEGCTRILEDGAVFERAGVGFSLVYGQFSDEFAARLPVGAGRLFAATGVSLVFHPRSPHVPTVHMNYRRLTRGETGWFGGGADLTPYYLDEDDAHHFHAAHKRACDRHQQVADYQQFKAQCDAYFHNHHRGEARGIGGTFFDYLTDDSYDREAVFAFVRDAADAFLQAYLPIVRRHRDRPYTEAERAWQLLRRGRYVEFNLLHDRGTTFGLKTGGRVESILMSMPPTVCWRYQADPSEGTAEAQLLDVLRHPRNWVNSGDAVA